MNPPDLTSQNPFLFVVGCPRSGTTLLQRMLNAHPQLAVANDTHFIPRALQKVAPESMKASGRLDPSRLPELVSWIRRYHRFPRLGVPDSVVQEVADLARTYPEFVRLLYTEFARLHDKNLGGEKTPDYVRYLSLLHRLFPATKIIHIIRDGRDVALSALDWAREDKGPGKYALWREEPVAVCALWWKWQVFKGRSDAQALPAGTYLELKYEQFVSESEKILRGVTDFLGLPFAQGMLNFNSGKVRHGASLSAKKAWLPPTQGLRDWRTQMEPEALELFEALAGDVLKGLGYPLKFKSYSPAVLRRARRCGLWWEGKVLGKE